MLMRVANLVLKLYYFGFFLFICVPIPQQKITLPEQTFAHCYYLPYMLDKHVRGRGVWGAAVGGGDNDTGSHSQRRNSASCLGSLTFSEECWEGTTENKL